MIKTSALALITFLLLAGCAQKPTPSAANVEDMMNPLCVVLTGENVTAETVVYKGKLYHVCCQECVAAFNKNPEKYVQKFNADPAAYGVK